MNQDSQKPVVTRMAPSPTGRFHVGGIRTAFYSYAFARKHDGKFILRIEDTDKERSTPEFEKEIYEAFAWMDMEYDEVYLQSEHLGRHQETIGQLIASGAAYEGEEAKDGNGKVIRFKNPNTRITFQDMILGEVSFDTTDLGDFVIARNIESPLYHLAVVVDDHDEGVTHVIRAQEHLANTPRQILILEALGFERPIYAHVPFILGPDGKKKLSKRDGDVAIMDYKEKGYLPDAIMNFLAFIGWNPGGEDEVFTKAELMELFDLEKVQKGPAGYNLDKLNWLNKEHIKKLPREEQQAAILPYMQSIEGFDADVFDRAFDTIMERLSVWSDIETMKVEGEIQYYFSPQPYEAEKAIWKKSDKEHAIKHLSHAASHFEDYQGEWSADALKESIWEYAEEQGKGDVLWPLRYSLSGRDRSPDPFSLLSILGKESSLERIKTAIQLLES